VGCCILSQICKIKEKNDGKEIIFNYLYGNRFDGNAPLFIVAQMSVWGRLSLNDLYEIEQEMKAKYDGRVEFVRADHFFRLYNEQLAKENN
jgi:hypothetical protein